MNKPDAIHAAMESRISFACNPEEHALSMEGEIRMDKEAWDFLTVDDEHAAMLFFTNLYIRVRELGVSRTAMKKMATKADEGFERGKRRVVKEMVARRIAMLKEEVKKEDEKDS